MNQIEDLQGRIQAALARIGAGTEALQQAREADKQRAAEAAAEAATAAQAAAAEVAAAEAAAAAAAQAAAANEASKALEQALDEEKLANAQLEERVRVLHARLEEAGASNAAPVHTADIGELAALKAEVELLRNEAGDPAEKQALRAEVTRLKAELEASANTAASERERLEDELAQAKSEAESLRDQIAAVQQGHGDQPGQPAVDVGAEIERQNAALLRLDSEHQQLRQANEDLLASNAALRDANAQALGNADLINSAMQAELEGLRAAQASDQAQVNAVLSRLEPLLATVATQPDDSHSTNILPAAEDL